MKWNIKHIEEWKHQALPPLCIYCGQRLQSKWPQKMLRGLFISIRAPDSWALLLLISYSESKYGIDEIDTDKAGHFGRLLEGADPSPPMLVAAGMTWWLPGARPVCAGKGLQDRESHMLGDGTQARTSSQIQPSLPTNPGFFLLPNLQFSPSL